MINLKNLIEESDLTNIGLAQELIKKQRSSGEWANPCPHYLVGEVFSKTLNYKNGFNVLGKGTVLFSSENDKSVSERINKEDNSLTHVNSAHINHATWNLAHLLRQLNSIYSSMPNNINTKFKAFILPDKEYQIFMLANSNIIKENGLHKGLGQFSKLFEGDIYAQFFSDNKLYAGMSTSFKAIKR